MSDLIKKERITIRFSEVQLDRIETAAALESRRRGEAVDPGQLVREQAMPGVDAILAAANEDDLAAAKALVASAA